MEIRHTHFRDRILSYILIPVIIVIVVFSYYRFMISRDYIVGYQGVCDPAAGKCFKNCEDDACTKVDYYSEMRKYEPDLYKECGGDITNCVTASVCLPSDRNCSITYCDDKTSDKDNVCQAPVGAQSDTQNNNQIQSINNTNNTKI